MDRARRRQFMMVAGALLCTPIACVRAQTAKHARIGYLTAASSTVQMLLPRFAQAMRKLGWIEGSNLTLERRYAEGRVDRLPELADELVQRRVDVIVVPTSGEAKAAQRASRSIPIVTMVALDPVGAGLTQSIVRPSANVTGIIWAEPAYSAKATQLMMELVPSTRRTAYVYTAGMGIEPFLDAAETAAQGFGVTTYRFPVRNPDEVSSALEAVTKAQIDVLGVGGGGATWAAMTQILDFAATNRLPAIYVEPIYVERGGLIAYSPLIEENTARAAALVDRILKGAKPAELPFEYPTRYEIVINLRTAKQLGIAVPQSVLLRADRVIE